MRKIYKIEKLLSILFIIVIIIIILLILKKNSYIDNSVIETSSNINSSYEILVDVEDSKLFLFENKELIKEYKCSGGKWSTPSPIGTWQIVTKAKWGEGFRRKLDGT